MQCPICQKTSAGVGYLWRAREREPIWGSGGGAPSGVQGQCPWLGGPGGEAPRKLAGFDENKHKLYVNFCMFFSNHGWIKVSIAATLLLSDSVNNLRAGKNTASFIVSLNCRWLARWLVQWRMPSSLQPRHTVGHWVEELWLRSIDSDE
jgi:hypothetical protein